MFLVRFQCEKKPGSLTPSAKILFPRYVGSLMEDRDRWIKRRAPSSRNGSLDKSGSFTGAEALVTLLPGDDASSAGPQPGTPRSGVNSAASPEASAAGSMEERDEEDDSLEVTTRSAITPFLYCPDPYSSCLLL
jgi:hypothetical protein